MVGSPFTAFTFCDLSDVRFRNCLRKRTHRASLLLQVSTCWAVSYLEGNVRGEYNKAVALSTVCKMQSRA